jgi:regulatory protein
MAKRPLPPLQYALYLLKNRSRSRKEITVKLRDKGYSDEEIGQTVSDLERIGLLDDRKYAENYVHDKVRIYRRGRHRIGLELIQKGVPKELVNEALSAIETNDELAAAKSLLKSKERSWANLTERKRFERAISLLQRRGFPGAVIRQVLKD